MKKMLIILALLIPLAGCSSPAASLHPLIPSEQAIAVPGLSGAWAEEEAAANEGGGTVWTFEEQKNREYTLTVQDPDQESSYVFAVRLARLGDYLFVDAILKETTIQGKNADTDGLWIPVHYFGRIEVDQDQLHVRLLGSDWLDAALKDGRTDLRHEMTDEDTISFLTAPTADLQEFAIRYAWDEEVFSYQCDFWRRKPVK